MIRAVIRALRGNPARELALRGVEKRSADRKAMARRMREEMNLAPDPRLA